MNTNTIQTVKLSDTKKYTIESSHVYDEEKGLIPVFYTEVLVLEGFTWTAIDSFMAFSIDKINKFIDRYREKSKRRIYK